MRIALACLILVLIGATTGPALADRRVALVVGNGDYADLPDLANPSRDATAMADTLEGLGFEVTSGIDLTYRDLTGLVREFGRSLAGADVALVYYAGHGVQFGGENYLLPVDAALEHPNDLDFDAVRLTAVLDRMERDDRVNIVLLDACRDNPLHQRWSGGTARGLVLGEGAGLSQTPGPIGTLVFFATQPDATADDGEGDHSPFTASLLDHIDTPGMEIADLVREVRRDVAAATDNAQIPWDQSSLTDRFFFAPPMEDDGTATATPPEGGDADRPGSAAADVVFWESIRDSDYVGDYEAYLERFPDGTFAALARMRIDRLSEPGDEPPAETDVASLAPPDAVETAHVETGDVENGDVETGAIDGGGGLPEPPPVDDGPLMRPHRASYAVTLAGQLPGITGATGRLDYTLETDCRTWTGTQQLDMTLFLATGGQGTFQSVQRLGESRDGREFTVHIEDRQNGMVASVIDGHARFAISGQPGQATFVQPHTETVYLPRDALFPAAHQQALLDHAHAGETTHTTPVFAGQPDDGVERAVARISSGGSPTVAGTGAGALAPERSWLIDLTFLKPEDPAAPPTRLSAYRLFEGGVMDDIRVERDGLILHFDLQSVQYLDRACP